MKPYYTWCACHRVIGQTDGAVLIIVDMEIRRSVTFWCACGVATQWHPKPRQERAPVPTIARICYAEPVEV